MSRDPIGEFEKLVLLAILRLEADAYGATVVWEIEERTGRATSAGPDYVALRRLARKGSGTLRRRRGHPGARRPARRYHTVTAPGLEALRRARDEWAAMTRRVEDRLGEAGS